MSIESIMIYTLLFKTNAVPPGRGYKGLMPLNSRLTHCPILSFPAVGAGDMLS